MPETLPPRHPFAANTPSKFIPEVRNKVVLAIRNGNHRDAAAKYAGVTYQQFRRWMVRGEKLSEEEYDSLSEEDQEYVDFYQVINQAEAEAEVAAVVQWKKFFERDYKASRDFLARRYPQRWGQKVEVSVSNKDDEILELMDSIGDQLDPDPPTTDPAGSPIDTTSRLAPSSRPELEPPKQNETEQ
jgi:hypothetical protein